MLLIVPIPSPVKTFSNPIQDTRLFTYTVRMKSSLLLICFLLGLQAYAHKADSLLNLLPSVTDTQRVKVLNELCMEYVYTDPEKARAYVTEAYQLGSSLNYHLGTAKALNRLGIVNDVSGKYDSAITCYQYAGVYYMKANNLKGKASTINNIGMLYAATGRYKRALANYYTALEIFEQLNDNNDIANCMNNIGIVYSDMRAFRTGLTFFKKAEQLYLLTGNTKSLASTYTNEGLCYSEISMADSAIHYYSLALQLEKQHSNNYGLGILYNDIGLVYQNRKEYGKALPYLFEALRYRHMMNDKAGEASTLLNISSSYFIQNKPEIQEKYLLASHRIALDIKSYRILRKTSSILFRFYHDKKQYDKALGYVSVMNMAKDSVLTEESARQIAEMQLKYDSEKQALEIDKKTLALENANLDIARKRSVILFLVIASVLIVLTALLLYNWYRHKKQREIDAQLLHQQELRNKAIIDAEEKERIRIARELHDGIGQQLSAVKMNLSALDAELQMGEDSRMHTLLSLVDDSVKEVRTVSHNMMPNALIRSGFVSATRDLVNKISSDDTLKIDLQVIGLNDRLSNTAESVLYRVMQECISNIVKHAQATAISIQMIRHDSHLNVMIEDNGKGFDTSLINTFEGIGLKNIISRVQYLNGTVEFDSSPERGTTVNIDVPL
jgi:two-component system NarL family sensor kinase